MTPIPESLHALPLYDKVSQLTAQNRELLAMLETMKEREKLYARAITKLINTPATSVASVQNGKTVDVFFDTGAVWRRVTKCFESIDEVRFHEQWIAVDAVPTTRPAIAQDLDDALGRLVA